MTPSASEVVMRRALVVVGIAVGILAVLIFGFVIFTVVTPYSADEVRAWFDAVGGVISAAAAVIVAIVGFRAQRDQAREAAEVQRRQAREVAEAERLTAAQAMDHARSLERERHEFELQREQERNEETRRMAETMDFLHTRRRDYPDLISSDHDDLTKGSPRPGEYRDNRAYGEALAVASGDVRTALESYEALSGSAKQLAYESLVERIRQELRSDQFGGEQVDARLQENPQPDEGSF